MGRKTKSKTRTRWIVVGGLTVLIVGGGARVGLAAAGDDAETLITGPALAKASAAALAHTGGGRVTGTEQGDEESRYEVEVTLNDGRQVDVQLDQNFTFVSSKTDRENPADKD